MWSLIFAVGLVVSSTVLSGYTVNFDVLSPKLHFNVAFDVTYESDILNIKYYPKRKDYILTDLLTILPTYVLSL